MMEETTKKISELLVNTLVESYGIINQIPTIIFKDTNGLEVKLILMDATPELFPKPEILNEQLSENERILILFNKINLFEVKMTNIDELGNLAIYFDDVILQIKNTGDGEIWSVSRENKQSQKMDLIIANSDGKFSIWDSVL